MQWLLCKNNEFSNIKIEYYRLKQNLTDDLTAALISHIVIEIFAFIQNKF